MTEDGGIVWQMDEKWTKREYLMLSDLSGNVDLSPQCESSTWCAADMGLHAPFFAEKELFRVQAQNITESYMDHNWITK